MALFIDPSSYAWVREAPFDFPFAAGWRRTLGRRAATPRHFHGGISIVGKWFGGEILALAMPTRFLRSRRQRLPLMLRRNMRIADRCERQPIQGGRRRCRSLLWPKRCR
jgi:hypothetical protein